MKSAAHAVSCAVCDSTDTRLFFSQRDVPAQVGFLAPTRAQALICELGDITLQHCGSCAHIWNSSFRAEKVGFEPEYDLSQFYSPAYRRYVEASLERLRSRYGFAGKSALEIACGKGEYLKMLLDAGFESVIGFDPTFVGEGFTEAERKRTRIYRQYYDSRAADLRPDFVVCRSALQYNPRVRAFMQSIRDALEAGSGTIVYFETSNSSVILRDRVVWYLTYETGALFSAASLARLFRESGFEVLDILPALDDSLHEVEARPAVSPVRSRAEAPERIAEVATQVTEFAKEYAARVEEWSAKFDSYRRQGKQVALWGAGMRAISLLTNVPEASSCVDVAVDVNVQRQGRYLPKTGQRVISPAELIDVRPDVVIATHVAYADEIHEQVRALGLRSEFEVLR